MNPSGGLAARPRGLLRSRYRGKSANGITVIALISSDERALRRVCSYDRYRVPLALSLSRAGNLFELLWPSDAVNQQGCALELYAGLLPG